MLKDATRLIAALGAIAAVSAIYTAWLGVTNATTVALTFLLVVLIAATTSRLWVALSASVASMLVFNYFFLPPLGTLAIAEPANWVALITFLAVSLVASNLSSAVRLREQDALNQRDEMTRLFELSRDVILMTDSREAISGLAQFIARRFELDFVAICLPRADGWEISQSGELSQALDASQLTAAFAAAGQLLASAQAERDVAGAEGPENAPRVRLWPLRSGIRAVGLLATAGRSLESGTLDALSGLAAIALERAQFLEERKAADLARQSDQLKSALLASLGHDLRTPLTAIRVAASNLQAAWLTGEERHEQSTLVLTEVARLTRLFQNILEMARIDSGAVSAEARWVRPAEIVETARDLVAQTLREHPVAVTIESDRLVRVDPRLTTTALSHLLENAAQYSPPGSPVDVTADVTDNELVLTVRDHGSGVAAADLPRLFERFFRGSPATPRTAGTGMGLAIARGLLAAQYGRIVAENHPGGGALFTVVIAAETRLPLSLPADA